MSAVEEYVSVRRELRVSIKNFTIGQWVIDRSAIPPRLNILLFGPQGSGKSSFIRSCYRALHSDVSEKIKKLEESLHRSDDGTLEYQSYGISENIALHDSRGQRSFSSGSMSSNGERIVRLFLTGNGKLLKTSKND
jgi:hypothetical protein